MSSLRSTSTGDLTTALAAAIAAVLDCPENEVQVILGETSLDGQVTVHLELERVPSSEESPAGLPAEASPADTVEHEQDAEQAESGQDDLSQELDEEAEAAADFLEGLLDALDLPGDLRIHVAPEQIEIELLDIGSGVLIGRRGQTLDAIQELARCVLQREFQRRSRVLIDAEGYRARRLEKLLEKAEEAIDVVLDTGEPERLEPMDVFERKAVHSLVAGIDGITSRSQGREPARRIVLEVE